MDTNKSWLWKKKSLEKALDTNEIVRKYLKDSYFEDFKAGKDVASLNCKMVSSECDCNAKDDLVSIHAKMAQEAIAAKEVAETEVVALKQKLAEALDVRVAAEKRLVQLDAELKQCLEQLYLVKHGQEEKVQEAVANKSKAYEGKQRFLEEKFVAACRKADALATVNADLKKDLLEKENLAEVLRRNKSESDAEFGMLMARVDSTEKENSFLRYEFRMLEKELEIRSVEREYSRSLAEGLQQQHFESVEKMAKLESECQRLNAVLRKRLQMPVALSKMKSEMDMLRRDQNDMSRRRKSNPTNGAPIARNAVLESSNKIPSKKAAILIERLCGLEEENKSLQALVTHKESELQDHRIMISRLSTKLTEAETQLSEKDSMELANFSPLSNQLSCSSAFDQVTVDKTNDLGSWGNLLSTEQEKPKIKISPETKMLSDINLMDDFVEMEKLAMVSVDLSAKFTGMELVPVSQDEFSFSETSSADASSRRSRDWLQDVLKAITEEHQVSKRSIADLLADINIVFGNSKNAAKDTPVVPSASSPKSFPIMNFVHNDANFSKSIHSIIELIDGISLATATKSSPDGTESILADYTLRVFHWRSSELNCILKQFSQACHELLGENVDFGNFAQAVVVVLDWLICNSGPHQDSQTDSKAKIPPVRGVEKEWANAQQTPSTWLDASGKSKPELKGIERAKRSLEAKLNSVSSDAKSNSSDSFPLQESEKIIEQLRVELETLRFSKGITEDQIEMQSSANEDLATQLTVVNGKLNEVLHKYSSLEMELETKSSSCEHLEATCLDLQLQLESWEVKISGEHNKSSSEQTELRTDWELATTPGSLNEYQEAELKSINNAQTKRVSLREQLLAESKNTTKEDQKSPNHQDSKSKEQKPALALIPSNSDPSILASSILPVCQLSYLSPKNKYGNMAIVPSKKKSTGRRGLLTRLLMLKKKRSTGKSTSLTLGIV